MADAPDDSFDRRPLAMLIRVGHELATRARRMSAEYMAAQLAVAGDTLVFTYERRHGVWVTGLGFDRELSVLPEWERWRPPGT